MALESAFATTLARTSAELTAIATFAPRTAAELTTRTTAELATVTRTIASVRTGGSCIAGTRFTTLLTGSPGGFAESAPITTDFSPIAARFSPVCTTWSILATCIARRLVLGPLGAEAEPLELSEIELIKILGRIGGGSVVVHD